MQLRFFSLHLTLLSSIIGRTLFLFPKSEHTKVCNFHSLSRWREEQCDVLEWHRFFIVRANEEIRFFFDSSLRFLSTHLNLFLWMSSQLATKICIQQPPNRGQPGMDELESWRAKVIIFPFKLCSNKFAISRQQMPTSESIDKGAVTHLHSSRFLAFMSEKTDSSSIQSKW